MRIQIRVLKSTKEYLISMQYRAEAAKYIYKDLVACMVLQTVNPINIQHASFFLATDYTTMGKNTYTLIIHVSYMLCTGNTLYMALPSHMALQHIAACVAITLHITFSLLIYTEMLYYHSRRVWMLKVQLRRVKDMQ